MPTNLKLNKEETKKMIRILVKNPDDRAEWDNEKMIKSQSHLFESSFLQDIEPFSEEDSPQDNQQQCVHQ